MKNWIAVLVIAFCVVALSSCAHQPPVPANADDLPGFFSGLWHGIIAPIAFVVGLFTDATVYAFPNTGGWYEFGFLIGVGGFSVSASRTRRHGDGR